MNVLHIGAGNLFGGIETLLVTLARHRGLCPEMTPSFALCFEGRLASELRQTGAAVYLLGGVRVRWPWTVWRARRTLARLFKEHRFEVVICHSIWPHAVFGPVARSARLPLVLWLHDVAAGNHWLESWAKRSRPDYVVCNSRFTAGNLSKLYQGVQAEPLYCPVGTSQAPFSTADRLAVRAELDTAPEDVVIVQVSRLERWKGHQLHLEALGKLSDLPEWACWLVGGSQRPQEARYLEELKTTSAQLKLDGRVRFLGQRLDVPRLLAAADIHCQPNTRPEPFGITFVEGLLAGLPIVTIAIGGAAEIVDDSCGILVPPNDPTALSATLRRLIVDPFLRSRLGNTGPSRARLLCDPQRQLARLRDLLERAIYGVLAA